MSETLHKIDFSQDALPVEIDLGNITPNQQEAIDRVSANRDATAYFTSAELTQLKDFIASGVTSNEFEAFLTAQLDEGLSSSDLSGESGEYSEKLDVLDEYAKGILFGVNGVMPYVENPVARDHIAVALASSLLGQIASNDSIDSGEFERIINSQSPNFTANLIANLGLLQSATATQLTAGGEKNTICMDVSQGTEFFDSLFAREFTTQQEIQAELESANTPDSIDIDFTGFDENILPEIQTIVDRLIQAGGSVTNGDDTLNGGAGTDQITEGGISGFFNGILENLVKFFKYIASFLGGGDPNLSDSSQAEVLEGEAPIEVSTQAVSEVSSFFQQNPIVIDGITSPMLQELFSNPSSISQDAKSIVEHIPGMSDDGNISVNLRAIFVETLPDKQDNSVQIPRIRRFMQEMTPDFSISNPDGSINTANLVLAIHKYQDFTVWRINQTELDEGLLFQSYFTEAR